MRREGDDSSSVDELVAACTELRELDPPLYLEILALTKRAVTAHKRPRELLRSGPQTISFLRTKTRGSA